MQDLKVEELGAPGEIPSGCHPERREGSAGVWNLGKTAAPRSSGFLGFIRLKLSTGSKGSTDKK
jgi:hypothetical protein